MIDRFLVCKGRFLFDRGTNVYFSPKVKQTWINCLFCLVLYSVYSAFYLWFYCVIRFPSIAPYLVFYCVFSLSFSCVFWRGGSSESFCLVHPPYALMCLLLWFYCILCDIIDITVFHSTVHSVLCPVFFFSASIVYPSTANYVFEIFLFCFLNFISLLQLRLLPSNQQ